MQRKIFFVINPIAGTGKKENIEELIRIKTTERKIPFTIAHTPSDGVYNNIEEEARMGQFTDICICGGDGTVNEVVNALGHLPVCFSILPAGSGNGLAHTAGIPKKTTKALALLFEGQPTLTDAFRVNDNFACMLAGLGLDAQVAGEFAKQRTRGLITYARLTITSFFKARAYSFELEETSKWKVDAMMITVSNSNQFGNQFTIAPQASLTDGLLDVVVFKRMNKLLFLLAATKQLLNGRIRRNMANDKRSSVVYFQTSHLKIANKSYAPFHIDGDPRPSPSDLKIEVLPKYFRLIHGKRALSRIKDR